MKIKKLSEYGYNEAMLGLSLSWASDPNRAREIAPNLAHKQGGHNKFLEMIMIWLDVEFPRYVWTEFDTYRVGITKQSASTMHTIAKGHLSSDNFEYPIFELTLDHLNYLIDSYNQYKHKEDFYLIKNALPEGFLQRRVVMMSYKTLQNIYFQRYSHRLPQWKQFLDTLMIEIDHPEFIKKP